jgi:hypothetical protein
MTTANIDLYEVLKGLGVDPAKAQAASVLMNESAWRELDFRLRDLAADIPTLQATLTTRFDGLDTRLRMIGQSLAVLKWMIGAALASIVVLALALVAPVVQRFFA